MQNIEQLIDRDDSAWPAVQQLLASSNKRIEILLVSRSQGEESLSTIQVTTRSPMGAIALESGGILVDAGWLRILGAGHPRLPGTLSDWNGLSSAPVIAGLSGAFVIAHDAVGGFFALDGGQFPGEQGRVLYLAPDTLEWENCTGSYSAFLRWATLGDLGEFYENARWPGWERDVAAISGDQGFSIYPPLWAKGPSVMDRSKRAVPLKELWGLSNGGWGVGSL